MEKGLHPRAKALVEALWTPRVIEEAWAIASDYLWEEAGKASDLLGGGQMEGDHLPLDLDEWLQP